MLVDIFSKPLKNVTKQEITTLKRLTLSLGHMKAVLEEHRTGQYKHEKYNAARVFIAYRGSKIVGWALVEQWPQFGIERSHLNIFVSPKHRRKGIGTLLVNEAKQYAKLECSALNSESLSFFEAQKDLHIVRDMSAYV